MKIERRDFIKGCAAAGVLLLPGVSAAAQRVYTGSAADPRADARIEKSIKAGFGDGFSVRAHTRSNGLTHADIEHSGNRYAVTSADLLDWKIVGFG